MPGGHIETFGLFSGNEQIGFQCFANYVPTRKGETKKMHFNRTVIHPDYVGLGLGALLINETSRLMAERGYEVMAKFSSVPVKRALDKHCDKWRIIAIDRAMKTTVGGNMKRKYGFREKVKTYSYRYIGPGSKFMI